MSEEPKKDGLFMGTTSIGGITVQPPEAKTQREVILDTARQYVTKDRQSVYDTPENNFGMIAELWSSYTGTDIRTHDVAAMMALLKIARIKGSPAHMDNWIDIAGYAACGGEVAEGRST